MDNPGTILVVDDSADDVTLLRLAMKQAGFNNPLEALTDADQAVQYLKGEGQYSDRKRHPLPALVLLDLKLPNHRLCSAVSLHSLDNAGAHPFGAGRRTPPKSRRAAALAIGQSRPPSGALN